MATQLRTEATAIELAEKVSAVLAKYAPEVDSQGLFPEKGLREIRASGLMGLIIPYEYGGQGASYKTMVEVAQILSSSCLSTGMIWAMHCQQVATIIDHAPEALRRRVLPRIASGEMYVASVTTERKKGGHLLTALAPLLREGDEIILSRDAPVVTGGTFGDAYLITMRASEDSPPSDVVLVFVERAQVEADVKSTWDGLGMRGTDSVGMSLKGRLPKEQLINPPGMFKHVAASTMIPVGHIAWASCWLGAARGGLSKMLNVFRNPSARLGYDIQSDLFAERLARIRLEIDSVSAYLDFIVGWYEELLSDGGTNNPEYNSPRFNIHINNLKLLASERLFDAINRLVELSGLRYGYLKNGAVSIERTFRDLRSASLMYSNDRLLVANGKLALLDRELFAKQVDDV
jgi:acyl-CoA dehydrogenase